MHTVLLLLTLLMAVAGQATRPDTPLQTMRGMAAAMRQGDAAGFQDFIYTGDDEAAEAFRQFMTGLVDLYGASRTRFREPLPHAYLTIPTEEQLAAVKFEINGDDAVGSAPGAPPGKFKRIDGQWKYDFRGFAGSDAAPPDVYARLGQNARDMAKLIRDGRFRTLKEADDEFVKRNNRILESSSTRPSTRPATRSGRGK